MPGHGAHLGDAAAKPDGVPYGRNPAELSHHEATNGSRQVGRQIQSKPLVEVSDRVSAGNDVAAVGLLTEPASSGFILVGNLADDLFNDIFHRDDAAGSSKLIEHDDHV